MIVGATPVSTANASPLYVMDIATRYAEWAAVRQAAIAGNIANADTPNYRARDIEPFHAGGDQTRLTMSETRPGHMAPTAMEDYAADVTKSRSWDVSHSGNTVSLDEQLMKADDTKRGHELSLSVIATFHRMLLASVSFQ
ncbi:flagellar basal body protein [Acuticoccus mangrovi]|uniref:Flagellar basal body rod protein FlgB n=1 Tax=Acuticoccus mangrovi TaxID=2796142 RepID=A0A934MFH6_9HYPH|nr:flagellar basal body protein [Acuticoccus mangrovi]MBJ3778677.1 flagellar basal body rod protein FlgB [Acuticoccus mangrovi]